MNRPVDCRSFREKLVHFQADELPAADRQRFQDHLDGCADCARRLEIEDQFLRGLKDGCAPIPCRPVSRPGFGRHWPTSVARPACGEAGSARPGSPPPRPLYCSRCC